MLTNAILSADMLHNAAWILCLTLTDYFSVIIAVLIDLRSGTVKARREGKPRTSHGYRRTVEKASRYMTTLLALTMVDVLLTASALLLQATAGWNIPAFPLFTTAGAIGLTLIEVKSVMENSRHKTDVVNAARSLTDLLSNPEITKLIEEIKKLKDSAL